MSIYFTKVPKVPLTNILNYTPMVFKILDIILYNHYNIIPPTCKKIIYGNEISYLQYFQNQKINIYKSDHRLDKN